MFSERQNKGKDGGIHADMDGWMDGCSLRIYGVGGWREEGIK